MFNKKIIAAVVGLAASLSANAFTIQSGDYKMTVDGYVNGTQYNLPFLGTAGGVTANATNIAAVDLAPQLGSVGSVGSEDSWGIVSIASIVNTVTNSQYFTRGTDGYLIGTITGLTDFFVLDLGGAQYDYSTGGKIELFKSATDYNKTSPSLSQAGVLAANSPLPLWLSLDFVAGASDSASDMANLVGAGAAAGNATYASTYNFGTGVGSGSGYLAVTGGTAAGAFDTNTLTTWANNSADAFFTVNLKKPTPSDSATGNWLASATSDVQGYSVPEPGSMALLGLGLMGLAGLRRRKQA